MTTESAALERTDAVFAGSPTASSPSEVSSGSTAPPTAAPASPRRCRCRADNRSERQLSFRHLRAVIWIVLDAPDH
jgi:hypothetical protein